MPPLRLLPVFLFSLVLVVQPATAQSASSSVSRYRGDSSVAMVDMLFGRSITPVRYRDDDVVRDLENGYLAINIMGDVGAHTLVGFRFGYVSPTPDDRQAVQGINLSGYSLGFVLEGRYPLIGENLFLLAGGSYDFVNSFGSNDSQKTNYDWSTLIGRLGAALRIDRVEIRGGASYRNLQGKETTSGDVDNTSKFEIERNDALFLEVDFNTDPGGHVGFAFEGGGTENFYFYFRRFF